MEPEKLKNLTIEDIVCLVQAERSYGDSWKKRGGIGAFMMLARKWDRLENKTAEYGWDVFEAIQDDNRPEGILDDIRDLRRYLLLVEEEMERESDLRTPIPDEITEGITLPKFTPREEDATDTDASE
tara:strand:+ start:4429 stop:4809 length:381 start_codon:yes stop_codon:yes gene_type:complete